MTTSLVAGLLVLLVTVLIADRVVTARQLRDRSRAIAAQAAIVMTQAARAAQLATAMLDGIGDREAAGDELGSYGTVLLIAAPMLIDAPLSRAVLEAAQRLAGELARALHAHRRGTAGETERTRLDDAVASRRLHAAAGDPQPRAARGRHRGPGRLGHRRQRSLGPARSADVAWARTPPVCAPTGGRGQPGMF